jgi:hypothetical protein
MIPQTMKFLKYSLCGFSIFNDDIHCRLFYFSLPDVLHRGVDEGILLLLLLCCILLFSLRIMANLNILKYCERLGNEAVQRNLKRLKIKLKGQAHEIEINYFDKIDS